MFYLQNSYFSLFHDSYQSSNLEPLFIFFDIGRCFLYPKINKSISTGEEITSCEADNIIDLSKRPVPDAHISAVISRQDKLLLESIASNHGLSRNELLRRILQDFRNRLEMNGSGALAE